MAHKTKRSEHTGINKKIEACKMVFLWVKSTCVDVEAAAEA